MNAHRPQPPRAALADVRIAAPTRGNRRLDRLLDAVNGDDPLKAWVHIQVVVNIALRIARLLFRRGVTPAMVADYGMSERDAEVVIAAAALFHCVGMQVHRADHEAHSLFLTADKLGDLLAGIYEEPERSIVVAEAMHAIIGHRRDGTPLTVEAGVVRVADALDMARGRGCRSRPATAISIPSRPTRSRRSRSRPGATGRCGWRS